MNNIQATYESIAQRFEANESWEGRYEILLDLATTLQPMDESEKDSEHLIQGCQSKVWMILSFQEDALQMKLDSDARLVRGILALVRAVYDQKNVDDVLNQSNDFIHELGLDRHLSPTRSQGLFFMIRSIKLFAMAYKQKKLLDAQK